MIRPPSEARGVSKKWIPSTLLSSRLRATLVLAFCKLAELPLDFTILNRAKKTTEPTARRGWFVLMTWSSCVLLRYRSSLRVCERTPQQRHAKRLQYSHFFFSALRSSFSLFSVMARRLRCSSCAAGKGRE